MIRALLLSASLLLLSCGKESTPDPVKPDEPAIVGTWKLETIGDKSGQSKSAYACPAGASECRKLQTYTFRPDGTLVDYVETTDGRNGTFTRPYTTQDAGKKLSITDPADSKEFRFNVTLSGMSLKLEEYETYDLSTKKTSPGDQVLTFSRQ